MASVPLAIVLVAALLVPLAVIPGTFGFENWPTATRERVTEHAVPEQPRLVEVVKDGSGPRSTSRTGRKGDARRSADARTPRLVATAPGPRQGSRGDGVNAPGAVTSGPGGSAGGPGEPSAPSTPSVPAPSSPAAESEEPSVEPQPGAGEIADADIPVLRDDAPADPVPPAAPITPAAPAEPTPPAPEDSDDGDEGTGTIGDIVRGIGYGRGHRLGFGHGRD